MKNETLTKITEYAKTRFTRLLILLVIFTFGFSMRTAVFAKYTSYINNLTSVIAGDFIFKSDYLYENGVTYTVNSYNGESHEIQFDLMNYENSLRYNEKGLDFFYTVEASVWEKNAQGAEQDVSGEYDIKITYGDSNGAVAAKRGKVTDDGKMPENSVTYGALHGLDLTGKNYMDVIGEGEGKDTIKVYIKAHEAMIQGGTIYLKVMAKTIPTPVMKEETVKSNASLSERINQYVIQTNEDNDDINVPERGVYYSELSATYVLNHTTSDAALITEVYPGTSTNYEVTYRLRCNDSTNGAVTARVFYDSGVVIPDASVGTSNYDRETKKRFFQVQVQPGGTLSMIFYKRSLDKEIIDLGDPKMDTFVTQVVTDSTQIDENEYEITLSASAEEGGTVTIQPKKAKMTKDVTVKVSPPGNMIIDIIHINTVVTEAEESAFSVPVYSSSVDKEGVGTFRFKMPNENVVVLPTYCYKILMDCQNEYGTATLSRTGAPVGTPINVITAPNEGYKANVTVKGSGEAFTANDDGNNAFSFIMPEGLTTVTVVFEEVIEETSVENPDSQESDGDSEGGQEEPTISE